MGFSLGEALGAVFPVPAIGTLLGGAVSGGLDYLGGKEQREADLQSAREQMAFQERMSSTAHQREVADLKLAGLNPALSAGGQGASSPQGAKINPENLMKGFGPAISSAVDMAATAQGIKESQSRVTSNLAGAGQKLADTDLKEGGWFAKIGGTRLFHKLNQMISHSAQRADQVQRDYGKGGPKDVLRFGEKKKSFKYKNTPPGWVPQ